MRAADAAKNTADLIEGTVKKVKEGSELVTKTNEAFAAVAESSTKVGEALDPGTRYHLERTREYSALLARGLDLG